MRRTRFMSWFFLVLSLGFFFVRDFRHALETPLADYWWAHQINTLDRPAKPSLLTRLYTLRRYVSAEELRALAEEAATRGDNKFVAFAALNLPAEDARADKMRLADKAVEADRALTWIYYPLILDVGFGGDGSHPSIEYLAYARARLDRLQAFDPDNAVPHFIRARLIEAGRGKDWPRPVDGYLGPKYLTALAKESAWRREMEVAFACPRYDSYAVRQFDLYRNVMRQRGWDHPMVVATMWEFMPTPNLLLIRNYANLLVLKFGREAEAAGQMDEALGNYWTVAAFGERLQLQGPAYIEQLIGVALQRIADRALVPGLKKAGDTSGAAVIEYIDKQSRQNISSFRAPLSRSSNYNWSVLLVNLFAGLVAVVLPLTAVAILYVNGKLWIRKEKKGRLYEVLTTAENYLTVLLFLSCLGLYLAFVPFAQNFAHYMTTNEPIGNLPPFLMEKAFPVWDNYALLAGLPLQNPFRDYVPFALAGVAAVTVAMLLAHRRGARKTPSS
jgi:hypothetical protein